MVAQLLSAHTDIFEFDVSRIAHATYGALVAEYRPLFVMCVGLWVLVIALEALQNSHQLRPVLFKLLRGVVIITFLGEPAVPDLFAELLRAPAAGSGAIITAIVGDGAPTTNHFGPALDTLIVKTATKVAPLLEGGVFGVSITGSLIAFAIFICLSCFLAVVTYIAALASFYQAALIFLLPFAIALYPWEYTRPIFDGVIRQGISFSLVFPLLNALLALVISPLIFALSDITTNLFAVVPFAVLAVVGSLLALQVPSVASGIAGGIGLPILKPR